MAQIVEATVELLDGLAFRATPSSGHSIVLDGSSGAVGTNQGPTPMELLLLGLGGCTGVDVIGTLRKMRQDVAGYEVRVRGRRAEEHPRVFTEITVAHVVRGRSVNPNSVRRAIELSSTRYCSVSAMLGKVARIAESFRVIDEVSGDEVTGTLDPTPD
jgi:putative redox protein